jgi:hypothetical protein
VIRAGEFYEDDEDPAKLEEAFKNGIPAVSELDVTELPWRVGTHYNIHVYAEHPSGDREQDIPVATHHTPHSAQHAVFAHNRLLRQFGARNDE